jgi:hypothetical protein
VVFGEPNPQCGNGLPDERGRTLLASFAVTSDVRAVLVEVNVAAGQRDQFGDPQPGLAGQQQQGVVAASPSGGAIGSGQQGIDLGGGEETHHGPVAAFRWDR